MQIKALFRASVVAKDETGTETVTFRPVPGNPKVAEMEPDNKDWSNMTPSGMIELRITEPKAYGFFVPGRNYSLTFEENLG